MSTKNTTFQTTHGIIEEGAIPDSEKIANQANTFMQSSFARVSSDVSSDTIDAIKSANVTRDESYAGSNQFFTGYYLEDGAKFVIPLLTPIRNMAPRELLPGIDVINWRAVTDYYGGAGPSVAAGVVDQGGTTAPPTVSYNWVNLSNTCKMIGVKDVVTFESEIYGKMFQGDVLATASARLIPALMQAEEIWLINSGQKLWAPPTPSGFIGSTAAGSVAAGTYWFLVTAVNANGETLAFSTTAPSIVLASTGQITFNIFTVPSAVSYNVYVGTGATQPANSAMWKQGAAAQFGSASALNQPAGVKQGYLTVTMNAAVATSGTAYSTVVSAGNTSIVAKSTNAANLNAPLTFDGIQALIYNNFGNGGSLGVNGETPLVSQPSASNGALGLADIDTLLENMYLNAHADPEFLFVSVKDHKKLSYLVSQSGQTRITVSATAPADQAMLTAGYRVTKYINQTTGRVMDVIMLPYLTQGTIIAGSFSLPFPVSAIDKPPFRIGYNRDMWSQVYPPDQSHPTQTMIGAYVNEAPIIQYLGGWGFINGVTLS